MSKRRVPPRPPARGTTRAARRARQVKVDPQAKLTDAYQRAISLHTELEKTPKWRVRRRRELEAARARACAEADGVRTALGADGGPPLLAILEARGDTARLRVQGFNV